MSEPFLSELRIFSFDYAPQNWAFCNGQTLSIVQHTALFSLLGTTYGGNGQTTFALPDLRGRIPIHMGNGYNIGQAGGEPVHTLSAQEMPMHSHYMSAKHGAADTAATALPPAGNIMAAAYAVQSGGGHVDVNLYSTGPADGKTLTTMTIANIGNGDPHENRQPYLTLNVCIALQGIYPSRN